MISSNDENFLLIFSYMTSSKNHESS